MKERSYEDVMREQIEKQINQIVYCGYCGAQIIHCSNDGIGTYQSQWEKRFGVHYDCAKKRGDVP